MVTVHIFFKWKIYCSWLYFIYHFWNFAPSTKEDSFIPNVFVDISDYFEKKIEIIKIFESEIAPHPFPRSERNLRALATLRGSTAGCEYAESFVLLKEIF